MRAHQIRQLLKAQLMVYPVDAAAFLATYPKEWGGTEELVTRPTLEYLVVKSFWKHEGHEHVTAAPALSRS